MKRFILAAALTLTSVTAFAEGGCDYCTRWNIPGYMEAHQAVVKMKKELAAECEKGIQESCEKLDDMEFTFQDIKDAFSALAEVIGKGSQPKGYIEPKY